MTMQSLAQVGQGGSGGPDKIPAALRELQSIKTVVVTGAAATTKINVAEMRLDKTTIMSTVAFSGGVPTVPVDAAVSDTRASGTVTIAGPADGATYTLNGRVYTFKDTPTAIQHVQRSTGGGANDAMAAALAAKINAIDGNSVVATAAAAVVTVKANAFGTAGNSITTVGSTGVTASGATLANGTATGGLAFATTNTTGAQVLVTYFQKP